MPDSEERFDVLDALGAPTGATAARSEVHRLGLFHRAVHVWLLAPATREVLLQRRAAHKDSYPGLWDVSSAGHVSAGGSPLPAARRELEEELGLAAPAARLEPLFEHLERAATQQRGRAFLNNEFQMLYCLRVAPEERAALDPAAAVLRDVEGGLDGGDDAGGAGAPFTGFALQRSEVEAVKWVTIDALEQMYRGGDASVVAWDTGADLDRLLAALRERCGAS